MTENVSGGVPSSGRNVLVIFNPIAGARRKGLLDAVSRGLADRGCRVTLRRTGRRGEAEEFARAAGAENWDVVAVAGGDGTINEAVNGLYGSDIPLAVIPMGTANVIAAEIGMPCDGASIAEVIASGTVRPIHLGVANRRLFVMMAGAGFDGRVVAAVSNGIKRWLGKGAFVLAALWGIFAYSGHTYRVTVDGKSFDAASVIVANGHYYGGRFTCAPMARLEESRLYACLFLKPGPWCALRYCTALVLGRIHRLPDVAILPAVHVAVEGGTGEPVQGDGDVISKMPMSVSVAEKTLRIVMPA